MSILQDDDMATTLAIPPIDALLALWRDYYDSREASSVHLERLSSYLALLENTNTKPVQFLNSIALELQTGLLRVNVHLPQWDKFLKRLKKMLDL